MIYIKRTRAVYARLYTLILIEVRGSEMAKVRPKVRPIKPGEVVSKKKEGFPDAVFEAFNELLAEKYDGDSAWFEQKEVVARMVKKGLKRNAIFDKGWLDIEEVYESAGWKVSYDKPGYNESYEENFTFEKK